MADKFLLRRRTFADVHNNTPDDKLEIAVSGTWEECKTYAETNGFVWRDARKYLFGGWWYKKPDGNGFEGESLEPDVDVRTPGK